MRPNRVSIVRYRDFVQWRYGEHRGSLKGFKDANPGIKYRIYLRNTIRLMLFCMTFPVWALFMMVMGIAIVVLWISEILEYLSNGISSIGYFVGELLRSFVHGGTAYLYGDYVDRLMQDRLDDEIRESEWVWEREDDYDMNDLEEVDG